MVYSDYKFDFIVTNPPFGRDIQVRGEDILSQYDLARDWQKDKNTGQWEMKNKLRSKQSRNNYTTSQYNILYGRVVFLLSHSSILEIDKHFKVYIFAEIVNPF